MVREGDGEMIDRTAAVGHHLRYNLSPTQPAELVSYVLEALDALEAGQPDHAIELPGLTVSAAELINDLRLWDMVRERPQLRTVRDDVP